MKFHKLIVLIIAVLILSGFYIIPVIAVQNDNISFGPEMNGLRLGLTINNPQNSDSRTIIIKILNTSKKNITLVGDIENIDIQKKYEEYLKRSIEFTSYPLTDNNKYSMQTVSGGDIFHSKYTLKPGSTLTVKWETDGKRIRAYQRKSTFAFAGLYQFHAIYTVNTKYGKPVRLRSNEQPFIFGNSIKVPKHTIAKIIDTFPYEKIVRINLGSMHKIKRGDVFEIISSKGKFRWKLNITKVGIEKSAANVEPIFWNGKKPVDFLDETLPRVGQIATLKY